MASEIIINKKLCKKCGICQEFCPKKIIEMDSQEGPTIKNPEECIQCRQCVFRCPDFAIELEERP